MENVPFYVSLVFGLTTCLTILLFYNASGRSGILAAIVIAWAILQSVIASTQFYTVTNAVPPRFALLVIPPLLTIVLLFVTAGGRRAIDKFDATWLTWLHIVRIPVEFVLYWLFLYKQVPALITFEGKNFDIIAGITAMFIAYFGYQKKQLGKPVLLTWNITCIGLLLNVVIRALLSTAFPFQQFSFEQPNVAMLYFPFVLLPGLIVPLVLFSHLVCIRKLFKEPAKVSDANSGGGY